MLNMFQQQGPGANKLFCTSLLEPLLHVHLVPVCNLATRNSLSCLSSSFDRVLLMVDAQDASRTKNARSYHGQDKNTISPTAYSRRTDVWTRRRFRAPFQHYTARSPIAGGEKRPRLSERPSSFLSLSFRSPSTQSHILNLPKSPADPWSQNAPHFFRQNLTNLKY